MKKQILSLVLTVTTLGYISRLPVQACAGNSQAGYIDLSGKLVIPQKFANASKFAQGLAAVKIGEKWGYIDKTGNLVVCGVSSDTLFKRLALSPCKSTERVLPSCG